MRSILFRVPILHFPIYAYGLMLVVAMFSSLFLARRLAATQKLPVKPQQLLDMVVIAMISGVVGARLFYIVKNPDVFLSAPLEVFKIWQGGLVFHGGVAGGTAGLIWFMRRHQLPVLKMGDLIMPCIMIGLAWGRVGCFLNGCCYGKVSEVAWTVTFPEGSPAYEWHYHNNLLEEGAQRSLPVHPVQLYASLTAAAATLAFAWLCRRKRFDGQIIGIAVVAYGVIRFVLEFFRDDQERILAGLTGSQLFSIGLFVAGTVFYMMVKPKP
tara:strand:- start:919 stop:1722 length:804 start_codon:yes stop_codon:yes gene_type:complete